MGIKFKFDEVMELFWNFLNSDGIVAISQAQDYFGWYWFETVSAERHVDIIYAVDELMQAAIGLSFEDMPKFIQGVMQWFEDPSEDWWADRKKRSYDEKEEMKGGLDMMFEMESGCSCDPMNMTFTLEGKMKKFKMDMMENWEDDKNDEIDGSESGSDSGKDDEDEDKEYSCPKPIVQNAEVFNKDGTVRPYHNPTMCAATKSVRNNAAVFWINCEEGKMMGYYMNFTAEYHHNQLADVSFEENEALYPTEDNSTMSDLWFYTIKSADHHDRCWTIKKAKQATSRSSVVYLKRCEPERLAGRQMWVVTGGHILLASETHDNFAMNFNWRSFVGIPYLGEGQKLKTRRVFDIALGGHQALVDKDEWEEKWENDDESDDESGSDSGSESGAEDDDKKDIEWPECVFIGNMNMAGATMSMFAADGHGQYINCAVITNEQAAAYFGKPGTFYSNCLFMAPEDLASATKKMFEREDHALWNDCQVISYDLLDALA